VARMPLLLSFLVSLGLAVASLGGCCSPYHQDQGALFGGLLGAGTGAIVGSATGHAGAGAAIGAGVGALSGAAIGHGQDEIEARNRALIAQQLGRQVSAGAVRVDDVVAMTKSGVNEELIVNHIRAHGMIAPLQTNDLIVLQQQGISPRVVATMQACPPQAPPPQAVIVEEPAPPVVLEYGYGPRYYPHRYYHY
jgi:hypothetical protein